MVLCCAIPNAQSVPQNVPTPSSPDFGQTSCKNWLDSLSREYYQGTMSGYNLALAANLEPTLCTVPHWVSTQASDPAVQISLAGSCDKAIAFAVASNGNVSEFIPNWVRSWTQKNGKKTPGVCYSQRPLTGIRSYVIVFSQSRTAILGLQPFTTTSTNVSPISGNGTITNDYGQMWNFTYSGTEATSTTSTVEVPYVVNNSYLYAVAYDGHGNIVSQHFHLYSAQSGGDPNYAAGYNLGGALFAINARGRLLNSVVRDITGRH